MANRTYPYEITWCWKEDGNKPDAIADIDEVQATTVQRAINKLVKMINEQEETAEEDRIKASDLMVIDVRCHRLNNRIIEIKRDRQEQAS